MLVALLVEMVVVGSSSKQDWYQYCWILFARAVTVVIHGAVVVVEAIFGVVVGCFTGELAAKSHQGIPAPQ